ncbi:MAG: chaperone modulator CbpM [Planctomycetes bacterium]|nr:chaperone modulator CbpM [Planctomycetota bacterium]
MNLITIRGRSYITLTEAAECYRVQVSWVEEVYEYGLLGAGETVEEEIAVPTEMLDRLAEIRRLQNQQGVNLAGIAIILDLLGR